MPTAPRKTAASLWECPQERKEAVTNPPITEWADSERAKWTEAEDTKQQTSCRQPSGSSEPSPRHFWTHEGLGQTPWQQAGAPEVWEAASKPLPQGQSGHAQQRARAAGRTESEQCPGPHRVDRGQRRPLAGSRLSSPDCFSWLPSSSSWPGSRARTPQPLMEQAVGSTPSSQSWGAVARGPLLASCGGGDIRLSRAGSLRAPSLDTGPLGVVECLLPEDNLDLSISAAGHFPSIGSGPSQPH